MYVLRDNLELKLSEVYPIELIRSLRLCVSNLIFRFFRTYDVDEVRILKDGKKVTVCDPSTATYRVGQSHRTNDRFVTFLTDLIKLYRFISQFSYELTEFVGPFKSAAIAAKKLRLEYKDAKKAEKFAAKKAELRAENTDKPHAEKADKPKRTATLSKAFVKKSQVEVPPPPLNNAWAERKAIHEAAQEAAAKIVAETVTVEDSSESDDDGPVKEVQADDSEFKVVVSKRQHSKSQHSKPQRNGNRFANKGKSKQA